MSPSLFSSKVPFESLAPGFMQGLSLSVKGLEESLGVVSARSLALSLSLLGLSDVPSSLSTVVAFSMTHPSPQLSSPLQGKAPGIYKACTVAGCERGHEIELPRTRPAFTGRACRWNTGHSVKSEFQIHLTEHPGASVLVLPNLAALLATTSGWPPRAVESAFQSPGSLFCESSPSTRLTIVPPSNTTLKNL